MLLLNSCFAIKDVIDNSVGAIYVVRKVVVVVVFDDAMFMFLLVMLVMLYC